MSTRARIVSTLAWWAFVGTSLTAQAQPQATQIGQHRMGETFEEWGKIHGVDLNFICQPKHTRAELRTAMEGPLFVYDFKRSCKELSQVRDSGDGKYSTKEHAGRDRNEGLTRWFFNEGKLSKVEVEYTDETEQQLKFLTDAFGPPANAGTSKLQNGYGAAFESVAASWKMPDGTRIEAFEMLDYVGYNRRTLHVRFLSKEAMEAEEVLRRAAEPANPYKR